MYHAERGCTTYILAFPIFLYYNPITMKSSSIKQKKKYKALIVDVDGTLVPNKRDGMPSKKVTDAIAKASKILHVGVATSRPYFILSHIFDHLNLSGPSIIVGGAQIIDTFSKKIIFEQQLLTQDVMEISKLAETLSIPIHIPGNTKEEILSKKNIHQKTTQLWIQGSKLKEADNFINELSPISTISVHKMPSWKNGKIDVSITHASATKQHAIVHIAKLLNIETHDIIGVGDGYNDFPLLMACGLKIAMGNAVNDLKAIADYVAPPVEEDGVADVIEKFIL